MTKDWAVTPRRYDVKAYMHSFYDASVSVWTVEHLWNHRVVHSMSCFFAKTPGERCSSSMGCEAAITGEHYLDIITARRGEGSCYGRKRL
jgi:hypothetical protein